MNKKFAFADFYMKYGFFVLTAIVLIIFFCVWIFYFTPEKKDEMETNICFNNYDCKQCLYKSYCEELKLNFNQEIIDSDKIICSDDFQNLTSIDFVFTILNKTGLKDRYPDCK